MCSNSRTGAEPDTKWVDHGLILSRSTSNVIVARLLCAYGRDGGGKAKGDKCGSAWSVLECQELGPTRSGFTVPPLGSLYLEKSNVSVAWLLRVVWEGVKRAGGGVASALCDTPTARNDDEGGRASYGVLCVTIYLCACTYGLLDVADACRNRHFHDYMQVPLMRPMPAVTVTSPLPRLHFRKILILDCKKVPSKVTSK